MEPIFTYQPQPAEDKDSWGMLPLGWQLSDKTVVEGTLYSLAIWVPEFFSFTRPYKLSIRTVEHTPTLIEEAIKENTLWNAKLTFFETVKEIYGDSKTSKIVSHPIWTYNCNDLDELSQALKTMHDEIAYDAELLDTYTALMIR